MGDLHRFYVDDLGPGEVRLDDQEAHHAGGVLRLADGSEVELFDGRGGRAVGRLRRVGRGKLVVTIERREAPRPRPRPAVHLAFSTPRGKRLDWLLEKATELGAASLQPVIFQRSVAGRRGRLDVARGEQLSEGKRQRWRVHCIAAAKQSGLDFLPELRPPVRLGEVLGALGGLLTLLGDPSDQARALGQALADLKGGQDILLLVGPEGGLTEAERQAALAAGVLPVRLGETVLRIETAAVALLAATIALCRH